MSADSVLQYLKQLCSDIDDGRPLKPFVRNALLPVAVPAALAVGIAGAAGCEHNDGQGTTPGGEPAIEMLCSDGSDDDGDGLVDCADDDCQDLEVCLATPEYAAPMPDEPPPNVPVYGVPNPDTDAQIQPAPDDDPGVVAEYAAPFEPEDSSGAVMRYMAPMPRE